MLPHLGRPPRVASSLYANPWRLGSPNGALSILRPPWSICPLHTSPSLRDQRLVTRGGDKPRSRAAVGKLSRPTFRSQYDGDPDQFKAVLQLVLDNCMNERLPLEPEQTRHFVKWVMSAITYGGANPSPLCMNEMLRACRDSSIGLSMTFSMTFQQATWVAFAILKEYNDNGLAWFILACTSQMNDVPAMIFTVATGLGKRSGNTRVKANAIEFALPKLEELGNRIGSDTADKDLLLVLGMMKERSREYAEALHYYERALDAEPEDESRRPRIVQEALRAVLKRDWDGVAAMKARLGDRDGARETLEMGAWERDDPMAWYQLARMHEQDSTLMRDYLRQAAKGGVQAAKQSVPEAAKLLGIWYVRQSQICRAQASSMPSLQPRILQILSAFFPKTLDRILGNRVTDNLRMGIEWLRVAAFYGQPDNHVFLGLALREIGQHEEGFRHIETVKASGNFDFEDYKNNWYLDIPLKDKTSLLGLSHQEIEDMLRQ